MAFEQLFRNVGNLTTSLFGKLYTFTRTPIIKGDSAELDTVNEGSPVSWQALAAVGQYKTREIDGEVIQRGDVQLIVAYHATYTPEIGDVVSYFGKVYRVMNVDPMPVNNSDNIAFICQLRATNGR